MSIPKNFQRRMSSLAADAVGSSGNGTLKGVANVLGRIDAYRSVIFPGAFRSVSDAYVQSGAILYGHDWQSPEIGMPTAAREMGRDLTIEAEFHDHADAQKVRGIVTSRLAKGKRVDLSIGFWPDYEHVADFKNGKDLMTFAMGLGCDPAMFDPEIADDPNWMWAIPVVSDWAETSIVTRGANYGSQVSDARSVLHDLSSGDLGASLGDHLDMVLGACQGVTSRARIVRARRVADGSDLSGDRLPQVEQLIEALRELQAELTASYRQPNADVLQLNGRLDNLLVDVQLARIGT